MDVHDIIRVFTNIKNRENIRSNVASQEISLRSGEEVMYVIEAEGQRDLGTVRISEYRRHPNDILGGALKAKRRRALQNDRGSTYHARRANRTRTIVSPLIDIARNLESTLIDDYDARKGRLLSQVNRYFSPRRSKSVGEKLECFISKVINVGEGIVLKRGSTSLDECRQSSEIARLRLGRKISTKEFNVRRRVNKRIDGKGGPVTYGDRSYLGKTKILNGRRLGGEPGSAEIGYANLSSD